MTDKMIRMSDALAAIRKEAWPEDGTYPPEDQDIQDAERATVNVCCEAIAALPAVSVGVKPLVWEQTADNAWVTQTYAIHQYWPHNNGHFRVHGCTSNVGAFGLKMYDTLQEAKDAAQAHHTARILAVLNVTDMTEPVAAPDPAAIREAALREAAELIRPILSRSGNGVAVSALHRNADRILALIAKGAAE